MLSDHLWLANLIESNVAFVRSCVEVEVTGMAMTDYLPMVFRHAEFRRVFLVGLIRFFLWQ